MQNAFRKFRTRSSPKCNYHFSKHDGIVTARSRGFEAGAADRTLPGPQNFATCGRAQNTSAPPCKHFPSKTLILRTKKVPILRTKKTRFCGQKKYRFCGQEKYRICGQHLRRTPSEKVRDTLKKPRTSKSQNLRTRKVPNLRTRKAPNLRTRKRRICGQEKYQICGQENGESADRKNTIFSVRLCQHFRREVFFFSRVGWGS